MSNPKLEAGINLGKSLLGAVFNNKTGNEGSFQKAQAIKDKNKVSLNPVMDFNNSASSSNNSAPAFTRGGYFKLFKK